MIDEHVIEKYKNLYESNPNSQKACFDYARALYMNCDYENAFSFLAIASTLPGKYNNKCQLYAGKILRAMGNYEPALNMLKSLLNTNETKNALFICGEIYHDLKDYDNALKCFEKLYSIDPRPLIKCKIANCYSKINKYDKAKELLNGIDSKEISYMRVLLEYGNIEYFQENYEKAIEYYSQINSPSNNLTGVKEFQLGVCNFNLGNYIEAKKHFKNADMIGIRKPAYYYLGTLAIFEGNNKEAINYFIKHNNVIHTVYSMSLLALAYVKNNNNQEAYNLIASSGYSKKEIMNCHLSANLYLYLLLKLNMPVNSDDISDYYSTQLMANYSDSMVLGHIKDRHLRYRSDTTTFSKKINVEALFDSLSHGISNDYKCNTLSLSDVYVLPVENVGSENEPYLVVVTLRDSNNIITMFPSKEIPYKSFEFSQNQENIDINDEVMNELDEEAELEEEKRFK